MNTKTLSLLLAFLLLGSDCFADTDSLVPDTSRQAPRELIEALAAIPEPGKEPLWLNEANVNTFHDLLPPTLMQWVHQGKAVLPVVGDLNYQWKLGKSWTLESEKNGEENGLSPSYDLHSEKRSLLGYPFGLAEQINEETNKELLAYKVLWNSSHAEAVVATLKNSEEDLGQSMYSLRFTWLNDRKPIRDMRGDYFRQFTAGDVFRKDLLRISSPPVAFGFRQVSWRYLSALSDELWINSPVIGKPRKVFGANRGDPLFGSSLSFDDLFVSASKIQELNAKVVEEKIILVPFPKLNISDALPVEVYGESGLKPQFEQSHKTSEFKKERKLTLKVLASHRVRPTGELSSGNSPAMTLWNFQTRDYPDAASWLPTSVYFVPRKVWVIETSPKDPFYPNGRELIVIDQESMLPIYKTVFSRSGAIQKTVVAGWGLAQYKKDRLRFPYLSFILVVPEKNSEPKMAVSVEAVKVPLGNRAVFDELFAVESSKQPENS